MGVRRLVLVVAATVAAAYGGLCLRRLLTPVKCPSIQDAIRAGDLADVRTHLKRGDDPNAKDKSGRTPLQEVAICNNADATLLLLRHGAAVDGVSPCGDTPLHMAADYSKAGMVELLIEHGAAVNASDCQGWTVLHGAAAHGHLEVVKVLLAHGVEVNPRTDFLPVTPLRVAGDAGHADVAELLCAHGGEE
jgi:ankyrin repeat protein